MGFGLKFYMIVGYIITYRHILFHFFNFFSNTDLNFVSKTSYVLPELQSELPDKCTTTW
jgi:hypothetical protein